jgi:hypothetical protein
MDHFPGSPLGLGRWRAAAFAAVVAAVVVWDVAAPHTGPVGLWTAVGVVSAAVIPGTLLLILLALPLWPQRWLLPAAVAFVGLAFALDHVGSGIAIGIAANFAKLAAATCAGWAFLALFERLWWVALIALVIPVVDAVSVWRGPTHAVTEHHFHIYTSVAIAFPVPGGGAAYLGPPDVLFYALFLAAAARWHLRIGWTWLATTGMYALTVVTAYAVDVGGLPALPFLSFGFLVANGDLLYRSIPRSADSSASS